jgi:type I restriction-modification system DNA methylase subunit
MRSNTGHRVTFFGQEKTATIIRLAKMNLAVHGLARGGSRPAFAARDERRDWCVSI